MSPGRAGRWSPASTSAGPRCRSSSPTMRDRLLFEYVEPTDRSSLVGQIVALVDGARRHLQQDIVAVGVAIPGRVDPEDGSVSMAVNLGITHLPLGPMVESALGIPTFVEHDARAAALWLSEQRGGRLGSGAGERRLRGDRDRHRGRRRPRRGNCSAATTALPARSATSPPIRTVSVCACGLRGCLETIAAGPGDRSPGRRGDGGRSQHRPVTPPECRGCLPCQFCRRRGRARDRRPSGDPPRPGDPIARPDPRRQADRHRRRRRSRRTRPTRTHPSAHRSRTRGLATGRGRAWRCDGRAACHRPRRLAPAGRRRSLDTASACERGWASDKRPWRFSEIRIMMVGPREKFVTDKP